MSAFDDLLGQGFDFLMGTTSAPTLTLGDVTRPCITTPVAQSKEMRDAGYWPKFHCIAELKRADFVALAIADRSIVTFRDSAGANAKSLKVIGIEDDPADPCLKLTLQESPGS